MDFIYIVRSHTNVGLRTAMDMLERFKADSELELWPMDTTHPQGLGQDLLQAGLIERAELLIEGEPAQIITPRPIPSVCICPKCNHPLRDRSSCAACSWLRFVSERNRWGTAGACPKCGFSFRYDGSACSHCGHGATQQHPLVSDGGTRSPTSQTWAVRHGDRLSHDRRMELLGRVLQRLDRQKHNC